jgi:hypothetical protein
MIDQTTTPDHPPQSAKIGQMIRSNELKMAGKLLATARGHLHQLAQSNPVFESHYERVALLRNELMEPSGQDFNEKQLLAQMVDEIKELQRLVAQHSSEPLILSQTLLKSASAIVLVYAQDMAGDAPLEI